MEFNNIKSYLDIMQYSVYLCSNIYFLDITAFSI